MADGFYLKGMKHFAFGDVIWKAAGGSTIKTALIDGADYAVNLTTHEFLSDVTAIGIEETSAAMTLIDAADDGILDANDVVFTGTAGDPCEGILQYKDTGVAATSPLLMWWDSAAGLPVTLGGDVSVVWPNTTNKIAKI